MLESRKIQTNPNRDNLGEQTKEHPLSEQAFALPLMQLGLMRNTNFVSLSLSSRTLYAVAKPELKRRAVTHKLLKHVLLGEQTEACAMIKANPKLLLIKAEAKDYSGRTIIATPFQAAIGAGDKPMWEMMLPYFEGLEPKEALRQFHEWFPKEINYTPASELQPSYNALALAIIHDEDHGQSAIEAFRITISAQKEIRQGNHFNLQQLIAAYQAYIDNYDALGTWANRNLYWNQVISYVLRQMTTYDAQVYCSGARYTVDNDEDAFSRTLEFDTGEKFFPLQDGAGLGFDFGCCSNYNHAVKRSVAPAVWNGRCASMPILENYVEQKQTHLQDLESHLSKECVISPSNCS